MFIFIKYIHYVYFLSPIFPPFFDINKTVDLSVFINVDLSQCNPLFVYLHCLYFNLSQCL